MDMPLRLSFAALLVLLVAIRLFHHHLARVHEPGKYNPDEGRFVHIARWLLLPPGLGLTLTWLFAPQHMQWDQLPLPESARWAGVPVTLLGLALLLWVHRVLGRYFSPYLRIREDHRMITEGPYSRVRHPMYTAFTLIGLGLTLVSAQGVVAFFFVGVVLAVVLSRAPAEEAMMVRRFGDEYRAYMQRTGMLLPRI